MDAAATGRNPAGVHPSPSLLRRPGAPLAALFALLTLGYFAGYFADPAMPGNRPQYPEGWWGWWDQSNYLASARALSEGDLAPGKHLYPLGYAILGMPFAQLWPVHPFVLVNLASLLVAAWAFVNFARRAGVAGWAAALLFLGSVATDPALFRQWVLPWTTSPLTAALWLLLWLAADHMAGVRRPLRMGLLVGAVAMLRPTELLPAAIILAAVGLHDLRARGLAVWGTAWRVALGLALVVAVGAALHVSIFGWKPSPYMAGSSSLGFSFHAFGWKAYTLLVEPRAWWGDGEGLIARNPWMGLALVLLPFAIARGPAVAALAVAAIAHLVLYISYVDLLPTGFWLFHNVHYMKWIGPALALLAWIGAAQAVARPRLWPLPAAASAAILLLLCVRIVPVAAGAEAATWRGLQIPGPTPGRDQSYFNWEARLQDREGTLRNIVDMRLWPVPQGTRLLALRRDIVPPVAEMPAGARPIAARARLGWPCWLPWSPQACRRLGVP